MVHYKYTKKNGKLYGPYLYENKRLGNKVITNYIGKENKKNISPTKIILIIIFLVVLISGAIYLINFNEITGKVALDIDGQYVAGEIIEGKIKFSLDEGELIPKDSKLKFILNEQEKEILLSELVSENVANGEFYVLGADIDGSGEGYGIPGKAKVYPDIDFQLLISNSNDVKNDELIDENNISQVKKNNTNKVEESNVSIDKNIGNNINESIENKDDSDKNELVEDVEKTDKTEDIEKSDGNSKEIDKVEDITDNNKEQSENKIENDNEQDAQINVESGSAQSNNQDSISSESSSVESSPVESTSSESSDIESSSTESSSGNTESITGATINENQFIIDGKAGKDNSFNYNLENEQNAELISGSVKYNGSQIGDGNVKLKISEKKVEVFTEYYVEKEGFGSEFVGKKGVELEIDLKKFNISALETGELRAELIYNGIGIVSISKKIEVDEIVDEQVNKTKDKKLIFPINESEINITEDINLTLNKTIMNDSILSSENVSFSNFSIKTSRYKIRLGEPVRWVKNITLDKSKEIIIEVPKEAENLSVVKIDKENGEESAKVEYHGITGNIISGRISAEIELDKSSGIFGWIKKIFKGITGRAVTDLNESSIELLTNNTNESSIAVTLLDNATNYIIEYYTDAPQAFEESISNGKRVIINGPDELNYTDVIAFTNLSRKMDVISAGKLKIYWKNYEYNKNVELKKSEDIEDIELIQIEEITKNGDGDFENKSLEENKNENIYAVNDTINETEVIINNSEIIGNILSDNSLNLNTKDNEIINENESSIENSEINDILDSGVLTGNVVDEDVDKINESVRLDNVQVELNESDSIDKDIEKDENFLSDELGSYVLQEIPFTIIDEDNDSIADYIEWVVPHLSNQTFEIIEITMAEHLDENKLFIEDAFEKVNARDDNWIDIPAEHYIRVTFERNLTKGKDITIYARSPQSTNVEIYEKNGNDIIGTFENVQEDKEYKFVFSEWNGNQDIFDLKVKQTNVEFDYVVDPTSVTACSTLSTANTEYQQTANIIPLTGAACIDITGENITYDGNGYSIWNTTYTGYGIRTTQTNTTIKNSNVTVSMVNSNAAGILIRNGNLSKAYNNTLTGYTGVYLFISNNNTIDTNFVNTSPSNGFGIYVSTLSRNNTVLQNTVNTTGTTGIGIYLDGAADLNNITSNNITTYGAVADGIRLINVNYSSIHNNIIYTNGTGIGIRLVTGPSNNTIIGNIINTSGSSAYGIYLATPRSMNNTIFRNQINTSYSAGNGIVVEGSSVFNNISTNTIRTNSTGYGILVQLGVNFTNVEGNIINILTGNPSTYGIYLLTGVYNTTITGNIINTTGGSGNYGIRLKSFISNTTIYNNNINTSGSSSGYGIVLSDVNTFTNVTKNTIMTSGSSGRGIEIQTIDVNFSDIEGNTITTFGASAHGISLSSAFNNTIVANIINTSGDSSRGILVQYSTRGASNNTIYKNSINTTGGTAAYGIELNNGGVYQNNITENTIRTTGTNGHGIYINTNVNWTHIGGNVITTLGSTAYGIYIQQATNNTIINNIVNATISDNIRINTFRADNNTLVNNTFISVATNDFSLVTAGINYTRIVDQVIRNYSIAVSGGGLVFFRNTSFGDVDFLNPINGSGAMLFGNASAAIRILNNSVFVNDTIGGTGLNRTANITIYGVPVFNNPIILKNGLVCPSSVCANFSVGQATASFNVTGFSTYSIFGQRKVSDCSLLNVDNAEYQQTADIVPSAGASCINITAKNVTFDGNGYSISSTTYKWPGIYSNARNTTIKGVNVTISNDTQGYGIVFFTTNESIIDNATIYGAYYGILLNNSFNDSITFSFINASGHGGAGVALFSGSNNTLSHSRIQTAGVSSDGVYLWNSAYSIVINNSVNTTGSSVSGILLEGTNSPASDYNVIVNNTINVSATTTHGITIGGTGLSLGNNSLIGNNIYTVASGMGIKLLSSTINDNNTIMNNTIYSYDDGISIASSSWNVIARNSINTTGASGFAIIISGTSEFNNISNNYIFATGSASHLLQISADNSTYEWNVGQTFASNGRGIGTSGGPQNVTVVHNTLNGSAVVILSGFYFNFSHNVINSTLRISSSYNSNFFDNRIFSSDGGVDIEQNSENITLIYNNITSNSNYGISIDSSNFSFIMGNNISSFGNSIGLTISNSENSTIKSNIIEKSGAQGIYLLGTMNNTFIGNIINNSEQESIRIEQSSNRNSTYNTFWNITISNSSSTYSEIYINESNDNNTFVDTFLGNYTLVGLGSRIIFKNVSFGDIEFLAKINGTGETLFGNASAAIRILNNSVFVNDTIGGTGLNRTANITLYGIRSFNESNIYKENVSCSQAMGCYNFTSLSGVVSFNVTGWSNYSIQDAGVISCQKLSTANTKYVQTANIIPTSGASCINITAANVTFDGNGYSISNATYNGTGIYLSAGNATIKNANINVGNWTTNYAIYLAGTNDSFILNNSAFGRYGIYLLGASRNNVTANTINTSGANSDNYGIYLSTRAHNNTISWNSIKTGGSANQNFGIYLTSTILGNNVNHNYVNTSGTTSNYGIYLNSVAKLNNISNNFVNTSGTGTNYGILLQTNVDNNTISANIIRTGGSEDANHGIVLTSTISQNNVTNNYINISGSNNNYGIVLSSRAISNNVSNNIINATGNSGNQNLGILLQTNANNNSIIANVINTGGSGNLNVGIYLTSSIIGNNITNNYINTSGTTDNYGITLVTNAFNNNLSKNVIKTTGVTLTSLTNYGIRVQQSSNNSFESNIINNSHGSAIRIDTHYANNNTFINNSIVSNVSWFDLDIATGGINDTWLIDQVIRNYSFTGFGALVNFKNETQGLMGQILFLEQINGSGEMLFGNASAAIRILNNSVFVNDTIGGTGLNRTANITIYGVPVFSNIGILKNGITCTNEMGCYNFSVGQAIASFNVTGFSNYSIGNNVPFNPIVFMNSTNGKNKTKDDLWCYATITHPSFNSRLNVTVHWYNNSALHLSYDYNLSYANNTVFNATLHNLNTTKGENWTCGMRLFDGFGYSAWTNVSIGVNITNTAPNVTLMWPKDHDSTTNRTTIFNWSGGDDDGDSITYSFNITAWRYVAGGGTCTEDIFANMTNTQFIPSKHLRCFYDNGYRYNWSVIANDSSEYGSQGNITGVNITAVVDISLPVAGVNFTAFEAGVSNDTDDNSPSPLVIQNDGNSILNISIQSTQLFLTQVLPNIYFKFKADNVSIGNISFDWVKSNTSYVPVPASETQFIMDFNYTNESADSAEIDINLTVPSGEPSGIRQANLTFTTYLAEYFSLSLLKNKMEKIW